jgi:hypothetical protein
VIDRSRTRDIPEFSATTETAKVLGARVAETISGVVICTAQTGHMIASDPTHSPPWSSFATPVGLRPTKRRFALKFVTYTAAVPLYEVGQRFPRLHFGAIVQTIRLRGGLS